MQYLTKFDDNTFLHACEIVGVQDVTDANIHAQTVHGFGTGNEIDKNPVVCIVLANGNNFLVRSPLQVVLMTLEEALEKHEDENKYE